MTTENRILAIVFLSLIAGATLLASINLPRLFAAPPAACWQPLLDASGNFIEPRK